MLFALFVYFHCLFGRWKLNAIPLKNYFYFSMNKKNKLQEKTNSVNCQLTKPLYIFQLQTDTIHWNFITLLKVKSQKIYPARRAIRKSQFSQGWKKKKSLTLIRTILTTTIRNNPNNSIWKSICQKEGDFHSHLITHNSYGLKIPYNLTLYKKKCHSLRERYMNDTWPSRSAKVMTY